MDILSFSTCIEIANSRNAIVFPCEWQNESAQEFAQSVNAKLIQNSLRSLKTTNIT